MKVGDLVWCLDDGDIGIVIGIRIADVTSIDRLYCDKEVCIAWVNDLNRGWQSIDSDWLELLNESR